MRAKVGCLTRQNKDNVNEDKNESLNDTLNHASDTCEHFIFDINECDDGKQIDDYFLNQTK